MRKIILAFLLGAMFLPVPTPLRAEEFIKPTRQNILQTLFRFGALDINNDLVIDDFARVTECDLFTAFRKDDFRWQKIRAGLRAKIRDEVVTYPTSYYVYGYLHLDRYDFENKIFKLASDNRIAGINSFLLVSNYENICGGRPKMLPHVFMAVLDSSLTIPGFVMAEADASALLGRMNAAGNVARQITAKFNLRIVFVEKVQLDYSMTNRWYSGDEWVGKTKELVMDARLDSIEFYEDKQMTKRIYVYSPN